MPDVCPLPQYMPTRRWAVSENMVARQGDRLDHDRVLAIIENPHLVTTAA